jgi:hypothetical protein
MRTIPKVLGTCFVVASLLMAPVQAQEAEPDVSTPTTLYFHIFDTFNRFVINTQPMNTDFFDVGGTNNPTLSEGPWTAGTDAAPVGLGPWDLNTIYGTSTPGPVEYAFIENGKPRIHPEHGIAKTVVIDDGVTPEVTMYLDLRDVIGTNGLPSITSDFSLEITLQEGDDTSRDAQLDQGKDIMHGKQTFTLVDASAHPSEAIYDLSYWVFYMTMVASGNSVDQVPESASGSANTIFNGGMNMPDGSKLVAPEEDGILALKVPLEFMGEAVIPKSEAYNVRLDWYQMDEAFGPDAFATGYMRLFSGEGGDGSIKQHHLDMNIMNPVYVEFIHPQVAAGTLLIHAGVNSPWGTYDIDADSVELTIEGPSKPRVLKQLVNQNQNVHGLHDQAAAITYLWDFRGEEAAEGDYDICISVKNLGVPDEFGTTRPESVVEAKDCAGFTITEKEAFGLDTTGEVVAPTFNSGDAVESPGVGLVPLVALLGAAIALINRRKNA